MNTHIPFANNLCSVACLLQKLWEEYFRVRDTTHNVLRSIGWHSHRRDAASRKYIELGGVVNIHFSVKWVKFMYMVCSPGSTS